jgi:hypothetical protein
LGIIREALALVMLVLQLQQEEVALVQVEEEGRLQQVMPVPQQQQQQEAVALRLVRLEQEELQEVIIIQVALAAEHPRTDHGTSTWGQKSGRWQVEDRILRSTTTHGYTTLLSKMRFNISGFLTVGLPHFSVLLTGMV